MDVSNELMVRSGAAPTEGRPVPMIDTLFVAMACRLLVEADIDPSAALAEAGIERHLLDDRDSRIPFRLNVKMLEIAARHAEDNCFGLRIGARIHSRNIGVLGYVAASSETMADAITHVKRYYHVLTTGESFDARTEDGRLFIEYRVLDPSAQHSRQNDDVTMMATLRIIQIVTGKRLRPDWVEFMHSKPRRSAEYRRQFGAPVRFGETTNAIVFPESVLDLPIRTADEQLLGILQGYCQAVLRERGHDRTLMQQVEEMVLRLLPDGPPKAETVASALGMSKRTLSRRLQEQGVTYRDLVDDLRGDLAERYLRDHDLRMSEIAYLLGYADLSAFSRAFNRWTGKSPSEYRQLAA